MKVLIDTSSLIAFVRYYLPFDKNKTMYNFIKNKIELKEILILDKVYGECRYVSKGIVVKTLHFISERKNQIRTTDLLPDKQFFEQLESRFVNDVIKNKLTSVEFETAKNKYLNSADAKLLLYALHNRKDDIVVVSEETETDNDNKVFKKLPAICRLLELKIITLPELIGGLEGIEIEFK